VGTQHFVLASGPQTQQTSHGGEEALAEVRSKADHRSLPPPERVGNQPNQIEQDEWEDGDSEKDIDKVPNREEDLAREDQDFSEIDWNDGANSAPEEKGPDYQKPLSGAVHREGSLGSDTYSSGSRKLDLLGEEDLHNKAFDPGAPPLRHEEEGYDGDLLYVEKGAELSHREAGQLSNPSKWDQRANHFQEFLNHKPRLEDAVNNYKNKVATVRQSARDVDKELDVSLRKFGQFNGEVKAVQDEVGHLKRSMFADSRESAMNSVDSFANYNKNGVYGSLADDKWVPDAGKWNIFKDFLFPNGKRLGGSDSS